MEYRNIKNLYIGFFATYYKEHIYYAIIDVGDRMKKTIIIVLFLLTVIGCTNVTTDKKTIDTTSG